MTELKMCDRCFDTYEYNSDEDDKLILYKKNDVFMFPKPTRYHLCQNCLKDFNKFINEFSRKQDGKVV